jgi:hypothetical protein
MVENAQYLIDKPPESDGGFMVPAPTIKLLPEALPKIGLLKPDTIRRVMDAYVLTETYLDRLILLGGKLQTNMPPERQLVYLDAKLMKPVIKYNKARAGVVKEAIDALAPYMK